MNQILKTAGVLALMAICSFTVRPIDNLSVNNCTQDDYLYVEGMGYKTMNVANNSMSALKNTIKDSVSLAYMSRDYDSFCVLLVKNTTAKDMYMWAVDSCLVIDTYAIEGEKLGKYVKYGVTTYDGVEHIRKERRILWPGEKLYCIRANSIFEFLLPYRSKGVNRITMHINYFRNISGKKLAPVIDYKSFLKLRGSQLDYKSYRLNGGVSDKAFLTLKEVKVLE